MKRPTIKKPHQHRRGHAEDDLQATFVQYFRLQYNGRIIMSIPNSAKRGPWLASLMKKTGLLAGASDIFIPEPVGGYSGMWIEFKIKPNKPTQEQLWFIEAMKARGYLAKVCYSFDEAMEAVRLYFGEHVVA